MTDLITSIKCEIAQWSEANPVERTRILELQQCKGCKSVFAYYNFIYCPACISRLGIPEDKQRY